MKVKANSAGVNAGGDELLEIRGKEREEKQRRR